MLTIFSSYYINAEVLNFGGRLRINANDQTHQMQTSIIVFLSCVSTLRTLTDMKETT